MRRQRVDRGLGELQRVANRLLFAAAAGDVLLDGEEVGDLALGVAHRGDLHLFLVQRAVLAAVDQLAPPSLAGENGVPQVAVELLRLPSGPVDTGVLSDRFLGAVSRHRGVCRIHILDRASSVGDDDAVGSLIDGRGQRGFVDRRRFETPHPGTIGGEPLLIRRKRTPARVIRLSRTSARW